ncbi:hypothetical protein F5Y18DRAFT_376294 [Xylariaceae sp. FL1019]|nr:hypothetical protein F5Y18DRAFT_376294 [Xylariaceae sp. FL1019]
MASVKLPQVADKSFNQKTAVIWIQQQPENLHKSLAEHIFGELLIIASKPKQLSGSACSKLCGFIESCSKSLSNVLKDFAFSEVTVRRLFDFFIEWNEQDAHRSMRLVLDYVVLAIKLNPDPAIGSSIRTNILNDTISVITLEASKPSTKSSMIALDHLIATKVVYLSEVLSHYQTLTEDVLRHDAGWDTFVSRVFAWMDSQNVWTAAGKLLATILTQPWYEDGSDTKHNPDAWHDFISKALQTNLDLLEPIKVYLLMPLCRADPVATLAYIDMLTKTQKLTANDTHGWNLDAMLWVAMLEAGKKTGIVSDPVNGTAKRVNVTHQLPAGVIDIVLCHQSTEARASGLSILLASPSTSKPFALETLKLLRRHLPSFYQDCDPKIRYEVLGHSRNMIQRLHAAIDALRRDLGRLSKKSKTHTKPGSDTDLASSEADATPNLAVPDGKEDKAKTLSNILREHEEFTAWYIWFLKDELTPTASYQRHITSLKAMSYFLKSALNPSDATSATRWPGILMINSDWFRHVLDLIMDPYDDVREIAASLIMQVQCGPTMSGPPEIQLQNSTPYQELQGFCHRANELAQKTARADHCDGAARCQELLCRWSSKFELAAKVPESILDDLERKLCAAEENLATAVLHAPVHGDFASLRYIWSAFTNVKHSERSLANLENYQDRAIVCCRRIWQAIQHILCDDSPEGHLPEELQQVEGLDTKDLLSYSFRAVHESSNLMRAIASNARYNRALGFLAPSQQNFENIGRLTFEQLSNLRHRGAFSTVSQTFTTCCQLVQTVQVEAGDKTDLLEEWYKGALECIYNQASTTRRSAGIPAIIVGILASKAKSPSFGLVMAKLQEIGREPAYLAQTDGSNLSQVHALNCLKDVFKTSFLSHHAEPHLTDCLQLAAQSLQSEMWAIRNCGLLLLRSLIDNLFGTSESKATTEAGWDGRAIKISYHKYKALPELLMNLLDLGKESSGMTMGTNTAEAVFPALDIIRRAGPPEGYRDKLYNIVSFYLGSRIWHVREIAARTLCSLLLVPTWFEAVESLVNEPNAAANKLHGALLTLKFLIEKLLQVSPDQLNSQAVSSICRLMEQLPLTNGSLRTCTESQAVYVDILNSIANLSSKESTDESLLLSRSLFTTSYQTFAESQEQNQAPVALLKTRNGETVVQQALRRTDDIKIGSLVSELLPALATDINVACAMLEAISDYQLPSTHGMRISLAKTYLRVVHATKSPEALTLALENLASLLDFTLSSMGDHDDLNALASEEALSTLWEDLQMNTMSPSLSDAIVRVSGPLVAAALQQNKGHVDDRLGNCLRYWGALMTDAGLADRTFDTRIAAVEAMNSLSVTLQLGKTKNNGEPLSVDHLPWLITLYDALTDDDIEVRETAALAATSIIGLALVPTEAALRLLQWLAEHFATISEFKVHVVERMIGHNFGASSPARIVTRQEGDIAAAQWVPAAKQLEEAMRFDDSLFVIEEHNQYIDEVQEARRWASVFLPLFSAPRDSSSAETENTEDKVVEALAAWTSAGIDTLTNIASSKEGEDGPLGWSSKPQVFAICARIMICGSMLGKYSDAVERGQVQGKRYFELAGRLKTFYELGRDPSFRFHPLLLRECGFDSGRPDGMVRDGRATVS